MFRKILLSAAVAGTAMTALPAAAQAQSRYGYYDGYAYQQQYRGDRYDRRYAQRRYDRRYYDQRYRGHYGRRCSGTTGTIIGAIAGGLLGRAIDGGRDRTAGTIIGGAAGALAGRAIDRDQCRR
jgi:outer membrane lipoprotein SlyB